MLSFFPEILSGKGGKWLYVKAVPRQIHKRKLPLHHRCSPSNLFFTNEEMEDETRYLKIMREIYAAIQKYIFFSRLPIDIAYKL